MSSTRPPTRRLVSSKRAPLETIRPSFETFFATRDNNDVNLDDGMW